MLLPFGNITVAVAFLIATTVGLWMLSDVGIYLFTKLLALDCDGAPSIKLSNPIDILFSKLPASNMKNYHNRGYVLRESWFFGCSYYYSRNGLIFSSDNKVVSNCLFSTKEDAMACQYYCECCGGELLILLGKTLLGAFTTDVLLKLSQFYFVPTICFIMIVGVGYSIRKLAKVVWKHNVTLDDHKKRLTNLENK